MKWNYKTAATATALLCLVACGKEKLVLDGTRIPVLDTPEVITADYSKGDVKISLPTPQRNLNWEQTGGNAKHNFGHLASGDDLELVWKADFGAGNSKRDYLIATPVVAGKNIFVIDADAVVSAYNIEDGGRFWKTKLKPKNRDDKHVVLKSAGIAYENGKVFAATGFGAVFALNPKDGEILWKYYDKSPLRVAPTVGGGKIFVQDIENTLIALDQETGEEVWRYVAQNEDTVLVGGASPAYDEKLDMLIVGFNNGELRAIKASTGSPLWGDYLLGGYRNNIVSGINAIRANPIIDNNVVYAAGNGVLVAMDIFNGQRLWEREFGSSNQPWIAGKVMYVLTEISHLLAIDIESGKIIWDTKVPAGEKVADAVGVVFAGPVLVNNRILVTTSNGYVFYVSPYTGEIMGFLKIDDGSAVSPVVADGVVLITTTGAKLLAYK